MTGSGSERAADVIVVGGGAAGLWCAITAGRRGRSVVVLEHNERIGKKIAISGGGRCNFTNRHAGPDNYLSESPRFCRSALARFGPDQFLAEVERHRISYHEKTLGQLFCTTSSRAIIDLLERECAAAQVEVRCGCKVHSVQKGDGFRVATTQGVVVAPSLVIATGGLSFPKLGATDFGYRLARQFGLRVTPLAPALVPLTLGEATLHALRELAGVSLPVVTRLDGARFAESLLFTHRGLSGPAVLQISSFWKPGAACRIDLCPTTPGGLRDAATFAAAMQSVWPRRFAEVWGRCHAPDKPLRHWTKSERREVEEQMHAWCPEITGTEGYPKAEVTRGGVDTRDLSSATMEARAVPGLFFVGEVVDVTGWLGGYNFQWAWASGHAAGKVA